MNINKKIEAIRKLPEPQRVRYAFAGVAICMFFIILIWIFSLRITFKNNFSNSSSQITPDIKNQLDSFKQTAPSLKDITNDFSSAINEDAATE